MERLHYDQTKRIILLCAIIFLTAAPSLIKAQDEPFLKKYQTKKPNEDLISEYWNAFKKIDAEYVCIGKDIQAVNSATFDSLLRPALSNVFIGSNDLIKNTTAASFTQDDKSGTLNLNYSRLENKRIWNIGAFSKATNGIFGIYTGDSWSSDVGINIGRSWPFHPGLFFDTPDCENSKVLRRIKIADLLKKYREVTRYDVAALKKDSGVLQKELSSAMDAQNLPKDYLEKNDQLHQIDSILELYQSIVTDIETLGSGPRGELLNDSLSKVITQWEVKNADIFYGYNIWWISVSFAISNNKLSLNIDSLPAAQKKNYTAKSLAKILTGVSFNWQQSDPHRKPILQYLSAVFNLGLHNYLDYSSVRNPGLRLDTISKIMDVYNNNTNPLGRYESIKANIFTFEPSVNYSIFFWAKKQFGFNIRGDLRIPIRNPEQTKHLYPTTFNTVVGPLFRLNTDKAVNAGTVGLDVGMIDCPVKSNVWKSFAFKLKIGVPFNALIK